MIVGVLKLEVVYSKAEPEGLSSIVESEVFSSTVKLEVVDEEKSGLKVELDAMVKRVDLKDDVVLVVDFVVDLVVDFFVVVGAKFF